MVFMVWSLIEMYSITLSWDTLANFTDEWSHCDFCFTNFGVILEYLESSITTKKAIFRLSSTWSSIVRGIVRDTRSSCGGPLTWKAQIHDGVHRVNFDRNLPSSCFIPANSHACGLKTSISRRLTLAGQFLTPDWKMWVAAVLLDTISKNMLTQTHVRNENHVQNE